MQCYPDTERARATRAAWQMRFNALADEAVAIRASGGKTAYEIEMDRLRGIWKENAIADAAADDGDDDDGDEG